MCGRDQQAAEINVNVRFVEGMACRERDRQEAETKTVCAGVYLVLRPDVRAGERGSGTEL